MKKTDLLAKSGNAGAYARPEMRSLYAPSTLCSVSTENYVEEDEYTGGFTQN